MWKGTLSDMATVQLSGGPYGEEVADTDENDSVSFTDERSVVWTYVITSENRETAELTTVDRTNEVSDETLALRTKQLEVWELIKTEHDRRKDSGVKVGDYWFHTDSASRIQQMGLSAMGSNLPPGIMWKTLSVDGGMADPVWVEMTPALAQAIFMTTLFHDNTFMAAKDVHRTTMLQAPDPQQYDFMVGWPESFLEVCGLL